MLYADDYDDGDETKHDNLLLPISHGPQVDMVSDQMARWTHDYPEIPKRMGNIYDVDKFDAQFFGVHSKQADAMDPEGRILQERAYEAITDAGINPKTLRGTRTGVFIGAGFGESQKTVIYERQSERGSGLIGYSMVILWWIGESH